jgi:hypothetical protein
VRIQAVVEEKLDAQPLLVLHEKYPVTSFHILGNGTSSHRRTQLTEIESNVFSMVSWERRISGASLAISPEMGAAPAKTYRPDDKPPDIID